VVAPDGTTQTLAEWVHSSHCTCGQLPDSECPPPPAVGLNGQWIKLGDVSVDSAMLAITDPAFAPAKYDTSQGCPEMSGPYGSGIQFMAGFGDGGYDVWAWIVDYGEHDDSGDGRWVPDKRIAMVVVTLIDDEDLAYWRNS
jgi:hypothetical protein